MTALEERGLVVWGKVVVTGSVNVPVVAGMQQYNTLESPRAGPSSCEYSLQREVQEALDLLDEEDREEENNREKVLKDRLEEERMNTVPCTSQLLKSRENKCKTQSIKNIRSVKTIGEELLTECKDRTSISKSEIELRERQFNLEIARLKFEIAKYKFENPTFSFDCDLSF